MRQLIIVISIITASITDCFSQLPTAFASQLLQVEKKIFQAENDSVRNALLIGKIELYIAADSINQRAMGEVKRVNPKLLNDAVRNTFLWNAALISFMNDETYYAMRYLEEYESRSSDSSASFLLLKYLAYQNYDSIAANEVYLSLRAVDTNFQCLECIPELEAFELKHKKALSKSAAFLPGLGMILLGHPGKGIVSMALNAATVVAVVKLIQARLIINAIGWGVNLISKFYMGNVRLTERLIENKEMRQKNKLALACELKVENILVKYPLVFKPFI